uniref:THUMP domain-containing protein n=1 Tax=Syphacia muris TaxID=451379 RepID=A0A0N5AF76_9BILA
MKKKRRQWFTGSNTKKQLDQIKSGLLFTYAGNEKTALLEANNLIDAVLVKKENDQGYVKTEKSTDSSCISADTLDHSNKAAIDNCDTLKTEENTAVNSRKRPASESENEDVADSLFVSVFLEKNARSCVNKTSKKIWPVNLGVKCCLFMSVDSEFLEVYYLADEIYNLMLNAPHCRKLQRVLPVETTCSLQLTNFNEEMTKLVLRHFIRNSEGKWPTYSVEIFRRNSNELSRESILSVVDDTVSQLAPACKVNLRNPDVTVLVQIVRSRIFLSCVKNFISRKKLRLNQHSN